MKSKPENNKEIKERSFGDTALPFRRKKNGDKVQKDGNKRESATGSGESESPVLSEEDNRELDAFLDLLFAPEKAEPEPQQTVRSSWYFFPPDNQRVPEKIQKMRQLYVYGEPTPEMRNKNFYRMGKFMENYTDDAPWNGIWHKYFPTYHDLNVRQLRGYFTWRTHLREGRFEPMCESVAYIYIYELLCGIGCSGSEDVLKKMEEFERGFLNAGYGTSDMRENVHRWKFEYAVIHALPKEAVLNYANSEELWKDYTLSVLRNPFVCTEEDVFGALRAFGGTKLETSQAAYADDGNGRRLFAKAWRAAMNASFRGTKSSFQGTGSLFTDCFGEQKALSWHPLARAIYYEEHSAREAEYILDDCRSYTCHEGEWREKRYDGLYFDREKFQGFLHECERVFRKYLKTGHYLRKKDGEEWATTFAEQAVREYVREKELQARPKIEIHFDGLDQIRRDAGITRDRLLTEEELDVSDRKGALEEINSLSAPVDQGKISSRSETVGQKEAESAGKPATLKELNSPAGTTAAGAAEERMSAGIATSSEAGDGSTLPLDDLHLQVLQLLLAGEAPDALMKAHFLIPSVVADTINEALFDEIGDNVLDCDGTHLSLVEDYREDVAEMLALKDGNT